MPPRQNIVRSCCLSDIPVERALQHVSLNLLLDAIPQLIRNSLKKRCSEHISMVLIGIDLNKLQVVDNG